MRALPLPYRLRRLLIVIVLLATFMGWGEEPGEDAVIVAFAANQRPTANAGPDQFHKPGTLITLDGSGSSDPDPEDTLQFRWTFKAFPGPTPPLLSNPRGPKPTFTPELVGLYELTLTVKDGLGGKASDGVVVNVQEPIDQIAQPCSCQGQAGDVIGLTVRVTDGTGNGVPSWPVTYTLVRGNGTFESPGTIPLSGQVRRAQGKPDHVVVANRQRSTKPGVQAVHPSSRRGRMFSVTASTETPATVTIITDDTGLATAQLRLGAGPVHSVEALAQEVAGDPAIFQIVGLFSPSGIAVERSGSLVVVDAFLATVLRVEPVSGRPSIVSDALTGRGPPFKFPADIAVEGNGPLVVVDLDLRALLRVDPVSGDRTIVSDATTGRGPFFSVPVAIDVEGTGSLVMVDSDLAAVLRVDPVSGDRTIVSDRTIGAGPLFKHPTAIAVEADGRLLVADDFLLAVVRVDPVTGNRTIISGCASLDNSGECTGEMIGYGPLFSDPAAIAVEKDGSLMVADARLEALLRVDPVSGGRTIVSGCVEGVPLGPEGCIGGLVGRGPPFVGPWAIAVKADGRLVVVDGLFGLAAVMRVDPGSGDRTVVSGCTEVDFASLSCIGDVIGRGQNFVSPRAIAVEPNGSLAVVDDFLAAVVRVDPVSGDRTLVSR